MRSIALTIAATVALSSAASAQDSLRIRASGPTIPEQIVEQTLAHRHIVRYEQYNTRLFRDSVFDTTVVVLNSDATVASTVHGDVVVINGDLFLQPGAKIDGRAIAIGGGVYDSQQATVGGEKLSYRDVHFDTARTASDIEESAIRMMPSAASRTESRIGSATFSRIARSAAATSSCMAPLRKRFGLMRPSTRLASVTTGSALPLP